MIKVNIQNGNDETLINVYVAELCVPRMYTGFSITFQYRPKARSLNKTSASYNVESGKTKLTDNYS